MLCIGVLAHVVRCFHCPASTAVHSPIHVRRSSPAGRRHVPRINATSQLVAQDLFIAVLRDVQLERAQEVARAVYKGGFRMMSITTNTKDFGTILRSVAGQDFPGLTLGASSVCSVQQVRISSAQLKATAGKSNTLYGSCYVLLILFTWEVVSVIFGGEPRRTLPQ